MHQLLFLSWESPWPAFTGAALRTLGLLGELRKAFQIELVVMTRRPLTDEQFAFLGQVARSIVQVPLRDATQTDRLCALALMASRAYPYHSAVLQRSLAHTQAVRDRIISFPGVVFTSMGHWGALVRDRPAPNWILNQCDADVEFWRVYASQASHVLPRHLARVNYYLARRHYPRIYDNVGRIISVCEEDKQHVLALAPHAQVDVIANGVDCVYLTSHRTVRTEKPRLLFTGTSAGRNVTALRHFMKNIMPLIQRQIPDVELLVAGNFSPKSQVEFKGSPSMRFTGRVDDLRPYFNQSDVFIAPFEETHGSKLKIAEAMAMGMPIVSTPQGVRGFELLDGQHALIADTDQEFASYCIHLLKSSSKREQLGEAARRKALETIAWPVLGKRLVEIVEDTIRTLPVAEH